MDFNLPCMSGLDFLRELRQDPTLRRSIVFMLTTSNLETDMLAAYDYQIAGYFLKTKLQANFSNLLRLLDTYRSLVEFPPPVTICE